MRTGFRAGRVRLAFIPVLLVLLALALTGGAAAGGDDWELDAQTKIVEITLENRAAIDALIAADVDLVEYVREEDDGRVTVNAVVTEAEEAELEAQGYEIGVTVQDYNTYLARMAERDAALAAEETSHESAESGDPAGDEEVLQEAGLRSIAFASVVEATPHELTVNRVDYFQNYAGWFLSVEVFDNLVNGTGSTGPTVSFSWRTATGSYGGATTIPRFIDTDPTPDVYMYNRVLVRIGPASPPYGPGAAPTPPAMVRVATSTPGVAPVEAPVRVWTGNPLAPTSVNFATQYFTAYMDPTQIDERFESLAAEFGGPGGIAELVDLPHQTQGYNRPAMCVMFGTTACNGTPGTTAAAVYLESKAKGFEGGNQIRAQFRNPGAANSPLTVNVLGPNPLGGSDIVVDLATSSTGALTSTAAQVRNAINAHPVASTLVDAHTYAGSAGGSVVPARALATLSDFLSTSSNAAHVQRGPFTMKVLRIGKQRDGSKTGVFLFCQQHAREWVTPITCVQTAEQLLRNYATDARTRELVDNLDIFILPSSNPDGSHYSLYDFNSQRRNLVRYCGLNTTSGMPANRNAWGVDLNRNSGEYSLFDGYFGASTSCTSDTFAGPSEYSEPESKNLNWVVDTFPNIKFANNIHTYGGYFMWAPGSYRGSGRVSAPAPNHGIEAYFFAAADTVLGRIKSVRGTAVLPQRTGPIADVLYSAAGNAADDMWYRKGIIGYSFEAGSDRFSSTTSGTTQSAVGFFPAFATEGRFEAQEFAAGNFGLLESALEYEYDQEAPEVTTTPAGPAASQTPIDFTFKWVNEPSVVYFTTDGSTPTTASEQWERQRMRGPGKVYTVDGTTTVKWLAIDVAGNSSRGEARFAVETNAPTTTATLSPAPIGGYYKNPTVTLLADDDYAGGGAGIESTSYRVDGGAWQTYAGAFQVTGDGSHTVEFFSTDLAGNVEATKSVTFDVDATKPTITLTTPADNGQYVLGSTVAADFECADNLSGVASCVGTVASGSSIDTSTIGFKTFSVNASDNAGNAESKTVTYNVHWPFSGSRPPFGVVNQWQAGMSFPVKFSLGGNRGLNVFAAGFPKSKVCGADDSTLQSTTASEPFAYADGQYTYSWKTEKGWRDSCRELVLRFVDNTEQRATFQFKK
ncbi:MAG TPA: M14 family zinc carboxypeptidase [Actinomycetota bacterium]|nr:M14 family zinc carboxypeptidase [Actinomycetota bacterium]